MAETIESDNQMNMKEYIWTPDIDAFFRSIADEMSTKRKHSLKCAFLWKLVSFLSIPLGVLSWVFGAAGYTSDSIQSSQSIVLLVIGACIVALERLKPKKYQQLHKTRAAGYEELYKTILFEVRAHKVSPNQLFHESLLKIRVLRLSAPDSLDSNSEIFAPNEYPSNKLVELTTISKNLVSDNHEHDDTRIDIEINNNNNSNDVVM